MIQLFWTFGIFFQPIGSFSFAISSRNFGLVTVLVSAFPGDLPPRVEEQDIPSPLEGAEGRALIAEATDAFISAQVLVSSSRQYETNQHFSILNDLLVLSLYLPTAREGNVFSSVCLSTVERGW